MFLRLDPKEIITTADILAGRIRERFDARGLTKVCAELTYVAHEAAEVSERLRKPIWWIRGSVVIVSILTVLTLAEVLLIPDIRKDFGGISDYVQGLQALAQIFVYAGAIVYFLMGLELRWKRARVLQAIRSLRSLAHVIDMHQFTKDPERLGGEGTPMSVLELTRYLNYCSEMLALISKISAIYVQDLDDAVLVDAAGDIEDLTSGLTRSIWQKINILDRMHDGRS